MSSILDDFVHTIGSTAESLASDIGMPIHELTGLLQDLGEIGIDVFSAASKFGLTPTAFLRDITDIMRNNPHQRLLQYTTAPIKPINESSTQMTGHWQQMATFHEETKQLINAEMVGIFDTGGSFAYSGPAADTLMNTHTSYQQYFDTLTTHAQTQQGRYSKLTNHTVDFLDQAHSAVFGLPTPMAAFGVMSFTFAADIDPAIGGFLASLAEAAAIFFPEDIPFLLIIAVVLIIIAIVVVIVLLFIAIKDAVEQHQRDQGTTTTTQPPQGPSPDQNPDPSKFANALKAVITAAMGAAILNKLIKDLTNDEREKLIQQLMKQTGCDRTAIEALLNAYPGATVEEIINALAIKRTIQQLKDLKQQLQNKRSDPRYNPADKKARTELQDSFDRMEKALDKEMQNLDQFMQQYLTHTLPPGTNIDNKLANLNNNLNGFYAEWKIAEYYGDRGELLYFGKNTSGGGLKTDIDVAIRDGNSIRWIQIKAYKDSFGTGSSNYKDLYRQINNTDQLSKNPQVIDNLKKLYPWFDGNIKYETDLINTQPLDPSKGGWQDIADNLRTDFNGPVVSTDPNDTGNPGHGGSKNKFDPKTPLNDPNFNKDLVPPPPSNTGWCAP